MERRKRKMKNMRRKREHIKESGKRGKQWKWVGEKGKTCDDQ